jgi:hypothetical protein
MNSIYFNFAMYLAAGVGVIEVPADKKQMKNLDCTCFVNPRKGDPKFQGFCRTNGLKIEVCDLKAEWESEDKCAHPTVKVRVSGMCLGTK